MINANNKLYKINKKSGYWQHNKRKINNIKRNYELKRIYKPTDNYHLDKLLYIYININI